jgi:hypothetical protein
MNFSTAERAPPIKIWTIKVTHKNELLMLLIAWVSIYQLSGDYYRGKELYTTKF